ncbi:MAG: hypothetical protein JEZ09_21510 [Salinivirgaceae bacterium]|nr:hypothetical protein [Salinivirgaceae bacterium]
MKYYALTLFLLVLQSSFAQEKKTYSGSFQGETTGEATYQYYENDKYERIYDGPFVFTTGTKDKKRLNNKIYREVKGYYVNGLKHDSWSLSSKYNRINGNFNNGVLDGSFAWKKIEGSDTEMKTTVEATFNNGILVGKYFYRDVFGHEVEILGNFSDKGYFDGDWKITTPYGTKIEDIRKYKQGVLFFRIVRETSSGKILYMIDSTEFVNKLFENINETTMLSIVDGVKYVIQESDNNYFDYDAIYNGYNGNGTTYVKHDCAIESCKKFENVFYGIKSGEIKIEHGYKRIVIDYRKTKEGIKETKYLEHIKKGDNYCEQRNYKSAVEQYNSSLRYMPNESYPKQQIEDITFMVELTNEIANNHFKVISTARKKNVKPYMTIYNEDFSNIKEQTLHLKKLQIIQTKLEDKIDFDQVINYETIVKAFGVKIVTE